MAIAAALEESTFALPLAHEDVPLTPEVLVPRLGERLVLHGIISEEQLRQALAYQQQKALQGEPCLLGQALMALGFVDQRTLDKAITEQILQLQTALQQSNRRLEERVAERTAELQTALHRLTELSQIKSNFISNISHELRTPLAHIKGYLELLAENMLGDLNEEQHRAVQTALRSTNRLEKLIEDLLQFSLATRGELTLVIRNIDFAALARDVCAQMETVARARKLHWVCSMPDAPCNVRVDPQKMEWVLSELLDNAIKFTPAEKTVQVTLQPHAGMLDVCVSDEGIGIPADRVDEIFEPFHQLDETTTRRYGGMGLGLALVKRILDAHGIPIRIHSQEGKGTSVCFSIPEAEEISG
ncbi:MAG: hypothetical protein D6755_09900 [Anaerolineae bacterium]|nr:MAG: hypothetical protein D6755_09900 [Anaerolineae bacterium]